MRREKQLVAVLVLTIVAAFVGSAFAQTGMMGGQRPMGQSPQSGEDKPAEQPSPMPMTPDFTARMTNACLGAMEGMAQMGRMMGGQGGTPQTPSEQRQ